jgi:8-amino-7-oxononanoate synthase
MAKLGPPENPIGRRRFRNTAAMISAATPSFDAAHYQGNMAIYATPGEGRMVQLADCRAPIVDFVRCATRPRLL